MNDMGRHARVVFDGIEPCILEVEPEKWWVLFRRGAGVRCSGRYSEHVRACGPRPAEMSRDARAHSAHIEPLAHGLEPECALDSLACRILFRPTGVHFGGKCFSIRRAKGDTPQPWERPRFAFSASIPACGGPAGGWSMSRATGSCSSPAARSRPTTRRRWRCDS